MNRTDQTVTKTGKGSERICSVRGDQARRNQKGANPTYDQEQIKNCDGGVVSAEFQRAKVLARTP